MRCLHLSPVTFPTNHLLFSRPISALVALRASGSASERFTLREMVTGQNGSGQNGTDHKMVWTKWYTDKTVLHKMVLENGTDKMIAILGIDSSEIKIYIFSN